MTKKEDDMIPRDPYEGVKPDFLPISEFRRRYPYGLSRIDFNCYRALGVYHSLLPPEAQDRLKTISLDTVDLSSEKQKRDYSDKVIAEIVEQYPEYFREGLLDQLKKVAIEMARAERIAENHRKRVAEKARAEESEKSESVQSETENKTESKPKSKPVVLHLLLPNHGNARKKKAVETETEKETEKESESEP